MNKGFWLPRGLIFRCSDWELGGTPMKFAQSPQALVFDSYVRIYFSTRVSHKSGTGWKSISAYCDYSMSLDSILSPPQVVKYAPSDLGAFDEDGIFPFSPFLLDGKVFALTTGWSRRVSVDVETGVGLMESVDGGASFHRVGTGPILTASTEEPFLVCDGFVVTGPEKHRIFYSFGTSWLPDPDTGVWERTYKIGQVSSSNINSPTQGTGQQILSDSRGVLECQALPTVVHHDDRFHMAFCHRGTFGFRNNREEMYDLGYAWSTDGEDWTRMDSVFKFDRTSFDSEMRCYPNIFKIGSKLYLLYNGNHFGQEGFGLAEWTPSD